MSPRALSGYKAVWLIAMFDLPVKAPEDRRRYVAFHRALIEAGFLRLQYSVYARYLPSDDRAETLRRRIRAALPPKGQVRLLSVTDAQFGKMEVYESRKRARTEEPPEQLALF